MSAVRFRLSSTGLEFRGYVLGISFFKRLDFFQIFTAAHSRAGHLDYFDLSLKVSCVYYRQVLCRHINKIVTILFMFYILIIYYLSTPCVFSEDLKGPSRTDMYVTYVWYFAAKHRVPENIWSGTGRTNHKTQQKQTEEKHLNHSEILYKPRNTSIGTWDIYNQNEESKLFISK